MIEEAYNRGSVEFREQAILRQRRASVIATLTLLTSAATAHTEGAWVLWKHSYEVWVDTNKDNRRRDVAWKKVKATKRNRTATTGGCARNEPSTTH